MKQRTLYMQRLTRYLISLLCWCVCFSCSNVAFSDEQLSSKDYVGKAWEALGEKKFDKVLEYTNKCIELYKDESDRLASDMTDFPPKGEESKYDVLNNVATCYFIQAEFYMRQGKFEEAKVVFRLIIQKYKYAEAWDPRGWYWSVAEKSKLSIEKIDKLLETQTNQPSLKQPKPKETPKPKRPKTTLILNDPGRESIVDYSKYGRFTGMGTKDYHYKILDQEGLSLAVGEGIYPNTTSIRWDLAYAKAKEEGRLSGSHWDFIYTDDNQANFFKWATASEPQGIRLFYTGLVLERAGLIAHAIKAYYAIVVNFPNSYGWTYWHTPWYVASAAIAKIKYLCRKHPELKIKLVEARIQVINGFDNDINNDIVITNPGRFVEVTFWDRLKPLLNKFQFKTVKRRVGQGKVGLVQYSDGSWQLLVDNKPYVIKGITYAPVKVGQSPDDGTLKNWMEYDYNKNGKCDGPYDAFIDKNRNNKQDINEPALGDFTLMKEMGVNTIRLYHQPFKLDKKLLQDMYNRFGIRVILGDFLGKYAIGSGASWYEGTDYNNPKHRENMLNEVKKLVLEFKDEPYVLMWLLGNENVYGVACNANKDPDAFFKFVNEVALEIKKIDKNHPIAIANGDTLFLDRFAKNCPDVDIFAANVYRGGYGFVDFWQVVKEQTDKPAFISEYGCSAYAEGKSTEEAEALQAEYHRSAWEDTSLNMTGQDGFGNALGAILFEWLDEWWKAYEPSVHDTKGLFTGPFPDGFMHEEWLGIVGQGNGSLSPFLRQSRKSYFTYKELWR
ncbi:MAG: glycoside hydrolase family 2 TIM barrel-domain containing protein [Candidatus Omnitrophota bacterium]